MSFSPRSESQKNSMIIKPHWFDAIFLLEARSGLTLVSANLSSNEYDEDLISGMFKALESFIAHISFSKHGQFLEEIKYGDASIIYERGGKICPLLAVGIAPKYTIFNGSFEIHHFLLNKLILNFEMKYSPILPHFKGNVLYFQDFKENLLDWAKMDIENIRKIGYPIRKIALELKNNYSQKRKLLSTSFASFEKEESKMQNDFLF